MVISCLLLPINLVQRLHSMASNIILHYNAVLLRVCGHTTAMATSRLRNVHTFLLLLVFVNDAIEVEEYFPHAVKIDAIVQGRYCPPCGTDNGQQ